MSKARVVNRLPQFLDRQQQQAGKAVLGAVIMGAAEASVLTPIDTSALLNSQYRTVDKDGTKIVGRVGYTAEYAMAVHDADNPQNFRRASAEKEFLRKGFERNAGNIRQHIISTMRTRGVA